MATDDSGAPCEEATRSARDITNFCRSLALSPVQWALANEMFIELAKFGCNQRERFMNAGVNDELAWEASKAAAAMWLKSFETTEIAVGRGEWK